MLKNKRKDTIDSKYHQQLKDFQESDGHLTEIHARLERMREELASLKGKEFAQLSDQETERLTILRLEIPRLEKELQTHDSKKDLTKYYLEVGSTLSNYYQALETKKHDLPSFLEITKGTATTNNPVQKYSLLYNAKMDPLNHYETEEETLVNRCEQCHLELELNITEGLLVCPECLTSQPVVIHTDKPSYSDSPCDNIYFSYQRINHFREKLARIQQRHNFKIPQQLEEKLCGMFLQIQEPFNKHIPADKTNFFSYNYVINKFLHITNNPEYAKYFPLLKSKENLYKADMMWKKICQELGLPFKTSN